MTPGDETVHDEACPLLPHSHAESQTPSQASPTPLPLGQLAALCAVRLVDPIAFTQLFPYVNDFMSDLHLTDDPSRIGFVLVGKHLCIIPALLDISMGKVVG